MTGVQTCALPIWTPKSSGYVNGPADAAKFNKPVGLAITAEGNLYIGDSENYAIRRIAIE